MASSTSLNCFIHCITHAPGLRYQHDIRKSNILYVILRASDLQYGRQIDTTTSVGLAAHARPIISYTKSGQHSNLELGYTTDIITGNAILPDNVFVLTYVEADMNPVHLQLAKMVSEAQQRDPIAAFLPY